MQNTSKQQRYVIQQTACSFQFCPRRTTSCSPEGIGNSSKESASAPATCNQTSEPRVDEFIGLQWTSKNIQKLSKSRNTQRNSSTWPVQPSLINTTINHHYLNIPQPHLHGKRMQKRVSSVEHSKIWEDGKHNGETVSSYWAGLTVSTREPSLQIARTVLHDWLAADWEVFHDIQSCRQTYVSPCISLSCYVMSNISDKNSIYWLATASAFSPYFNRRCPRSSMLQPSNRSNGVSIASLSIGLPHHGVSSREILVEPCCYLCLQF